MRALATQHDELDRLLVGLAAAGWAAPSRCPGWSVADVVLHLAQTDELALASTRGAYPGFLDPSDGSPPRDVDEAAARAVDRERGPSGPAVHERWRRSAAALRDALTACDPRRPVPWVTGDLPARTLATTRLAEAWIHTGDVAAGVGADQAADERLWHVARLAWRTLPYAFTRAGYAAAGAVAVELVAPDGSSWTFSHPDPAPSVVRGPALEFCLVAARRLDPAASTLTAGGPDGAAALRLFRTFA